jgi:hypothetical protein
MENEYLYIVINQGEVVFVSKDENEAHNYADEHNFNAQENVLGEWGNDDPTDEDIAQAAFQAGFDGEIYFVEEINSSDLEPDGSIECSDGSEIDVTDILDLLEKTNASDNDML